MRWCLSMCVFLCLAGCQGKAPKHLSGSGRTVSPEGWRGKRYFENGRVISEEWNSTGDDDRMDLWRFYDEGRLLSEERDRDGDGRIDCEVNYDPDTGELRGFSCDRNFDGRTDLTVAYQGGSRWRQALDHNQDDTVDVLFTFAGPSKMLTELRVDPAQVKDLREQVRREAWEELVLDRDFDRRFDAWTRFRDGQPHERGTDENRDGKVDRWVRVAEQKKPTPASKAELPPYTEIVDIQPAEAAPTPMPQTPQEPEREVRQGEETPTVADDYPDRPRVWVRWWRNLLPRNHRKTPEEKKQTPNTPQPKERRAPPPVEPSVVQEESVNQPPKAHVTVRLRREAEQKTEDGQLQGDTGIEKDRHPSDLLRE